MHRVLARLFHERGVKLRRTSQLNVGGNMDFFNMLERERLESKKISKTNAVTSIVGLELPADDVHVGPSDYVPWLTDRKWAHIRLEGEAFGDVPLNAELKLEVWDSPELGRHRHRRRALPEARAQPRRRRPARRPELVPHEVAAQPAARRRGARRHREVHRQVRRASPARRPRAARPRPARPPRRPDGWFRGPRTHVRGPWMSWNRPPGSVNRLIRRVDAKMVHPADDSGKRPAYLASYDVRNRAGSALSSSGRGTLLQASRQRAAHRAARRVGKEPAVAGARAVGRGRCVLRNACL